MDMFVIIYWIIGVLFEIRALKSYKKMGDSFTNSEILIGAIIDIIIWPIVLLTSAIINIIIKRRSR